MNARYIARITYVVLILISILIPNQLMFLTLNVSLAYIPLELAYLIKFFIPRRAFEWPLFIIYLFIFILMLRNTFYMVTDLIHLNQFTFNFLAELNLYEWFHFTLLISSVIFSLYCYVLIVMEIYHLIQVTPLRIVALFGMMVLSGLGIYVGRFLRFHSVHIINHPFSVIVSTLKSLNLEALIFVSFIILIQALLFLFVKGVRSRT
ncbi:DUF1361 domain-containing protein [Staphylococcus pseudintermedius]|nr:DUF1361 domain-containing protein [Staphylococcus pseudintermedius]EHV5257783.1 DUF1361 domain-containing protein [Staphylococcus pseudintermedius]ELW0069322.1 DUF1361 domain-containing protein [Staphylococcus pseudintermedius]HAR6421195.1 DUF1361 domain-containing protein [Staphylococcus pseudintermedius]